MDNPDSERMYKREFIPAEWIPSGEAAFALKQYADLHQRITVAERDGCCSESDYIRYKATEIFCTDPELKDFWALLKGYEGSMTMSQFGGIFWGYNLQPKISKTDRDDSLKELEKALKTIISISKSDNSVHQIFNFALNGVMRELLLEFEKHNPDSFKISGKMSYPPETQPYIFFEKLKEKIAEKPFFDTHTNSPRQAKFAERVYFMNRFSGLVNWAYCYKRRSHAMTARILNKIRSDLGHFDAKSIENNAASLPNTNASNKR